MINHPLRVLVADEQALFRQGLKSLFQGTQDFRVVAEAETGKEAIFMLESVPCDLAMLNIHLHDPDGIATILAIHEKYPDIIIVGLADQLDEVLITRILHDGARGCLLKNASKAETIEAMQHIAAGELWVSPQISSQLLAGLIGTTAPSAHAQPSITPREKEVLVLICQEFTNPEIAEKLNISRRTVDTHRNNLLQKLGVRNTVGLIKYALQKGLLDNF